MKCRILATALAAILASALSCAGAALDGEPYIHDPSTVVQCDGKYYTFGTGQAGLVSTDGWTWHAGGNRPGGGAAPDVIHIGDRYYVAYAQTGGGLGGNHAGSIHVMWTKTLDPQSSDFGYKDNVIVATSDGVEDCDAIDPSFLLDPTDGRLWVTYGTFFGFIRLVELDPKTGHLMAGNKPVDIAIDCEATDLIYHDGWYYLLGDHGTCCNGGTSTYNIVVGRSKKVTGPYEDNMGQPMLKGGGKMLVAASGRFIGPGHFGLMDLRDGVQKFSCHYEADLDRSGRSVLDLRPLMWKDGWPVAGDNILKETTFKIDAGGVALMPVGEAEPAKVQWTVAPAPNAGGYLGMPYMKITDGNRVLAVNPDKQLVTVNAFTGAPEQLWRLEQLVDGSWRIMSESADKDGLALTAPGGATVLGKYDFKNASQHWNLKDPTAPILLKEGTYEIQSARSGFALELAVDGATIRGGGRGGGRGAPASPVAPIPLPDPAQVAAAWPAGNIDLRIGDYMLGAHQKWTITRVPGPQVSTYKITIAGTNRALPATADKEVTTVPAFSGKPEELWLFEKLEDGSYRITPTQVPNSNEPLVLTAVGGSTSSLAKFDPSSDKCRWNLLAP